MSIFSPPSNSMFLFWFNPSAASLLQFLVGVAILFLAYLLFALAARVAARVHLCDELQWLETVSPSDIELHLPSTASAEHDAPVVRKLATQLQFRIGLHSEFFSCPGFTWRSQSILSSQALIVGVLNSVAMSPIWQVPQCTASMREALKQSEGLRRAFAVSFYQFDLLNAILRAK